MPKPYPDYDIVTGTDNPFTGTDNPFTITFPSVEAALAELGRKLFGASIVIANPCAQESTEPQYRPLEQGEEIIEGDEWQTDEWADWQIRAHITPGETLNLATLGGCHTPHRRLISMPAPTTPATPSEEMTAWMDAYRRRGEDIDKLLGDNARLEAEAERLHAHWHEAATEVTTLRDEVKRLVEQIKDLTDQRNGLLTANEDLTNERDELKKWKADVKAQFHW